MNNGDEKWLETLRSKVESAPAELPEGGVEALCADVARLQRRRRLARSFVALGSAAAAALAIFLTLPKAAEEDIRTAVVSEDEIAVEPYVADEFPVEDVPVEVPAPKVVAPAPVKPALAAVAESLSENVAAEKPLEKSVEEKLVEKQPVEEKSVEDKSAEKPVVQPPMEQRLAQAVVPVEEDEERVVRRRISAGVHLALDDAAGGAADAAPASRTAVSSAAVLGHGRRTANIFPGYRSEYEHMKPINFGVGLSVPLSRILSLETGLTYSFHNSRKHNFFNSNEIGIDSQKLHFVGVPLGLRLTAFQAGRSSIYGYAGLLTQKCVYATWNGDRFNLEPVVLSGHLSAGYQFAFSDMVGIYVEPGISCFEASSDEGCTIYSQSPWQFELRGGLRFTMK